MRYSCSYTRKTNYTYVNNTTHTGTVVDRLMTMCETTCQNRCIVIADLRDRFAAPAAMARNTLCLGGTQNQRKNGQQTSKSGVHTIPTSLNWSQMDAKPLVSMT